MSTGAGPFTLYQSVGGSRRPARSHGYYAGPTRAEIARAEKQRQAEQIMQALRAIDAIARESFPPAVKPKAAAPALPPYPVLLRHFEQQELHGIGLLNLRRRRAAKQRARELADRQTHVEIDKARSAQAEAQREVDARWEALWRNDPYVVLAELSRAFEDNRAPTAAVGVEQDTVHLTVLVPPAEQVIPERYPTTTAAGNLSLARMPKKISAGWYRELVAGHVLVSAKETFAVAPGLRQASVVAFRHAPEGGSELEPLLATVLSRMSLQSVDWAASRAWEVLTAISSPLHKVKGSAATLVPIELHDQPDLAKLAALIDVDDDLALE